MAVISSEMERLCKDIESGREHRKKAFKDLQKHTEAVRDNARKFVVHCRRARRGMARNLNATLAEQTANLVESVESLRKKARRAQGQVRSEIQAAGKTWNRMQKGMK